MRPDRLQNGALVSERSRRPARRTPNDDALAWALASSATPHLAQRECDRIYIAIGVGETFVAIHDLTISIARERIPLSDDLVATVTAWLDCYVGHDAEPRLRQLIGEVKTASPQRVSKTDEPRRYLSRAARYGRRRSAG
jgi:hypothetical protein